MSIINAVTEKLKKEKELLDNLNRKSDSSLKSIISDDSFFGASSKEKRYAKQILRKRGY